MVSQTRSNANPVAPFFTLVLCLLISIGRKSRVLQKIVFLSLRFPESKYIFYRSGSNSSVFVKAAENLRIPLSSSLYLSLPVCIQNPESGYNLIRLTKGFGSLVVIPCIRLNIELNIGPGVLMLLQVIHYASGMFSVVIVYMFNLTS